MRIWDYELQSVVAHLHTKKAKKPGSRMIVVLVGRGIHMQFLLGGATISLAKLLWCILSRSTTNELSVASLFLNRKKQKDLWNGTRQYFRKRAQFLVYGRQLLSFRH